MKKIAVILSACFYSCAQAQGIPVGAIIFSMSPLHGGKWLKADGRCLSDIDYPVLAEALHDGEAWPYGRCDKHHFKLPDLRSTEEKIAIPNIRTSP